MTFGGGEQKTEAQGANSPSSGWIGGGSTLEFSYREIWWREGCCGSLVLVVEEYKGIDTCWVARRLCEFPGFPDLGSVRGDDYRGQKINANFFCTKFFDNLSGHGRPRRKSWTSAPKSAFSCGAGGGEKLFDPWGIQAQGLGMSAGKSGPKSLCLCCFFFPALTLQSLLFCLQKENEDLPKKEKKKTWIFLSAEPLKSLEKRAKKARKNKENTSN